MVLDGRTAAEKYVIFGENGHDHEEQIQPNGVDLRVERIWEIEGAATLPASGKMDFQHMRKTEAPYKQGFYNIKPGRHYLVDCYETIAVPDGYCAIILPRSSMLRVGAFLTSALWDTGFTGQLGASMRPYNPMNIQVGARVCQVMFLKSVFSGHRYSGRYQGNTSQTSEF